MFKIKYYIIYIIDLNIICFLPEYVATSLAYGWENNNITEKKDMLIVDIGYMNTNVCVCSYEHDKCDIIANNYSKNVNGRAIDRLLYKKFQKKIETDQKIKLDDPDYKLVRHRLQKELVNAKRRLSAIGADSVELSIDLLNDESYDGVVDVKDINQVIDNSRMLRTLKDIIKAAIDKSQLSKEELKNMGVLPVGGSLRIPYLQKKLSEIIKEITGVDNAIIQTISMDECVSSGCTYYGCILNGWSKYKINNVVIRKVSKELKNINTKVTSPKRINAKSPVKGEKRSVSKSIDRTSKDYGEELDDIGYEEPENDGIGGAGKDDEKKGIDLLEPEEIGRERESIDYESDYKKLINPILSSNIKFKEELVLLLYNNI